MGFLQLIIFFFNYCRARCFSPLCHGILGTFQRWNLKVTSPVKSIFEFFPSVGKFLQLMFLGDNICMRASGLILPVMAMTVALNTNVSWFIWDCHCRYFFPGPGNRELHMAETFSTEPGKVRLLCEGRNSPFMRKWLRFFFFVCLPELLFCDNTAYGSLISEIFRGFQTALKLLACANIAVLYCLSRQRWQRPYRKQVSIYFWQKQGIHIHSEGE